jgi:3-hydroxyisobutyrate dehydrogenase
MANATKERVGIVGVGRMGFAMLKHLVKRGYPVTACDIDNKQLAKAREAGATTVKTPAEVARAADFVIIGVGYDDEINEVVLGAEGLLAELAPGSIIAVSSTAKPDTVKALDKRAQAQGVGVLDAPICRGRFAADEGTLLALVGGKADVVERGRAVYGCFCSDYAHLGEVGHGQVGKTMNNLLLWINAVGLIEAGRLAESTGIDLVKLRAALLMSSGASDALKEWDMISFTWALKDMQIVADLTDKAGLSLPITGAIKELVKDARRIKATNARQNGREKRRRLPIPGQDRSIAETPPSTNRLAP